MTLAQNHLPLLSGNKILTLFLALFFAVSCGAKPPQKGKIDAENTPIVIDSNSISNKILAIEKSIIESEKNRISDSITNSLIKKDEIELIDSVVEIKESNIKPIVEEVPDFVKNDFINLALILPFNTSQVPLNYSIFNIDSNKTLDDRTKMAMEFYHGFKLAYNKYKKSGLKANLFVLDDSNDEEKLKKLLTDRPFPYVDLVVGPVFNKNIKIMANYCKENRIPMISPLSSSSNAIENNPYYYMANTPNEAYYENIIKFIKEKYADTPIDAIYDPNDSLGNVALNYISKAITLNKIAFKIGKTDSTSSWYNKPKGEKRLVLITSYKETFTNYLVGRLEDEQADLQIIGMPNWNKMKGLDFGTNYPHDVYLFSNNTTKDKAIQDQLAQKYEITYARSITDNVYQAYDLFSYIFELYQESDLLHANQIIQNFNNSSLFKYKFVPMYNENHEVKYMYNSSIELLKLSTFGFTKVN